MKRTRAALVLLLAAALLVACGQGTPDEGDDMETQRPTWTDAEPSYQELLVAVRTRLSEMAPAVEWDDQVPEALTEASCDEVEGGTKRNYGTGGGGAIPDEDWGQVPEVVSEVVEPEGFEEFAVVVDEPGRHSISFYGPHGAELVVGAEQSTTVTLYGGCFVDPEAGQSAG